MSRSSTTTVQTCLRDGHADEPRHRRCSGVQRDSSGRHHRDLDRAPKCTHAHGRRIGSPTIRRHCSKSRSTTPAPILRPRPASSTWSSTTERRQAILRMRSSRSPKSTTAHPPLDLDGDNSTLPGTSYRTTFTENGTPVAIADTDTLHRRSRYRQHDLASATITLTNPQIGDLLTATGPLPGGITAVRLQPGHRNPDALRTSLRSPTTRLRWRRSSSAHWRRSGCGKPHHRSRRQRRSKRQPGRDLACHGRGGQ